MTKKMVNFNPAERLQKLPPYLFAEIDKKKRDLIAHGKDVVDLGVGDPDIPTPDFIVDTLREAARDPNNHPYPSTTGMVEFRESVGKWFQKRYNVKLDPHNEILSLIGSKEGIGHLPLAILNPGDVCLVPDPGYPVYESGTIFAGATPYYMPLLEKNSYLPDFSAIPKDVLKKAKLMFLNYPNNPTSQPAGIGFFEEAVNFAKENEILIAHDAAYSEITYDGFKAPSFLEVEGAKDIAIEFHSLSKTFNMTGWRVGFAVGNKSALAALGKIKANMDSGIFQAIQLAGKKALDEGEKSVRENLRVYQERRDFFIQGLNKIGWKVIAPKATFYCWIPVPPGYTSSELALKFLNEMNIVVTPGNGFGLNGEGYFRISLTVPKERLEEALKRIEASHHTSS